MQINYICGKPIDESETIQMTESGDNIFEADAFSGPLVL